ncbi:MAG: polymer-forming cytoskeletal protein [Hyphomicrobium sp.]|jgi:cytoskeletal protein CcmA (bactofilin family)|nr:polymer-forming cytoskeletal protein [Hyphomicrobium sp.]
MSRQDRTHDPHDQHNTHHPPLTFPRGLSIEGVISYPGSLTVGGTIEGDVSCAALVITERGIVNGSVRAETVMVLGEVNGEIYANTLTLKAASCVVGDIFHKQLALEDGCFFEGRSRRHSAPLLLGA